MGADFNGDGSFNGADLEYLGPGGYGGEGDVSSGGCGCSTGCGGCLAICGLILLGSLFVSCAASCLAG